MWSARCGPAQLAVGSGTKGQQAGDLGLVVAVDRRVVLHSLGRGQTCDGAHDATQLAVGSGTKGQQAGDLVTGGKSGEGFKG